MRKFEKQMVGQNLEKDRKIILVQSVKKEYVTVGFTIRNVKMGSLFVYIPTIPQMFVSTFFHSFSS
ncbi:unnamed protein product [Meloidogyne enterolobii]|uniref:Uncharacterized protein n=1 Tax=Meloidogyne enterolobii TaxID=390850 RepID=A0ACB0Y5P3_MELEN